MSKGLDDVARSTAGRSAALRAEPAAQSQAKPAAANAVTAKDLANLVTILERTGGKAWEPPMPSYPWLVRMIDAGYLARCDMRCGFEAFKDSGLRFTDAGLRALAAVELADLLAFLISDLPEKSNAVGMFSLGAVSETTITDARALIAKARGDQS